MNAEERVAFDIDSFIIICTVQNLGAATQKSSKLAKVERTEILSSVFENFEEEYLAEVQNSTSKEIYLFIELDIGCGVFVPYLQRTNPS